MANETTYDIKLDATDAQAKIDRLVQSLKDAQKYVDSLGDGFRNIGNFNTPIPGSISRGGDASSGGDDSDSATERDLNTRFQRSSIEYQRVSLPLMRTGIGIGRGAVSGLSQFGMGGGLGGLAKGFEREMTRTFSKTGGWAANLAGVAAGSVLSRSRAVAKGGGGGESSEEGTVASGAEAGEGYTILKTIKEKVPFYLKAIAATITAELILMEKMTQDVYTRSRRAGGFGTNMGQMTAFETTMNRYVDPDNVISSMTQAKYDITSPAYTAMRIAGIDPSKWKDPTMLAEGNIASAQRELKAMGAQNESTLLTMAHARGFGARGFNDEDIMRLYKGDQNDVNSLLKKTNEKAPFMDLSADQQKAYKDLMVYTDLAGQEVKTLGERLESVTIPGFMDLDKGIMKTVETLETYKVPSFSAYVQGAKDRVNVEDKAMLDWFKQKFGDMMAPSGSPTLNDSVGHPGWVGGLGGAGTLTGPGRAPSGRKGGATERSAESIGPIDLGDPEAKVGSYSDAMRVMMKAGLTRNEAAGMAGNATAESGLGTMFSGRVLGVGTGDSGSASGMFQWHSDRWNKQVAWAKSQGLDPSKPSTQYKMGAHEWITEWRKKYGPGVDAAKTPEQLERAINPFEGNLTGPGRHSAVSGTDRGLKEGPTGPQSMNNMSHFQQDKKLGLTINNPAGANFAVSGGMLGNQSGNYG
jgi:hypothetical protein